MAGDDAAKIAELTALVDAVRQRVSARYPNPGTTAGTTTGAGPVSELEVPIVDLLPLIHVRDAAQAKIAAIGGVNPRPGGLVNGLIQQAKKMTARALGWFVRDQVVFNREMVSALEATIEALNEQNRAVQMLVGQANERFRSEAPAWEDATHQLSLDLTSWREAQTSAIAVQTAAIEAQALRNEAQYAEFEGKLVRNTLDIQSKLWADVDRAIHEFEHIIYTELRVIRQKAMASNAGAAVASATAAAPSTAVQNSRAPAGFDYARFAQQFRGTEDEVRRSLEFYRPWFAGLDRVLKLGCGRGEFLELARELGCRATGIDLSEESVGLCRSKGFDATVADLFDYLRAQPEGAFDGIFCAQVVEHIEAARLPEMIRLCASRLRKGGVLAIETPNPECLAIFATHFYLDPTHVQPLPPPLLGFCMQEAGFSHVDVRRISPAVESMPELRELPQAFRDKFFGGLDYAIIGRRL